MHNSEGDHAGGSGGAGGGAPNGNGGTGGGGDEFPRRRNSGGKEGAIESKKSYDSLPSPTSAAGASAYSGGYSSVLYNSIIPLSAIYGHIRLTSITSCYKIKNRIGLRGAYGVVRKAIGYSSTALQAVSAAFALSEDFDNQVAVKILTKPTPSVPLSMTGDSKSQSFYKEVRILKSVSHPKIVKFIDAYEDETSYYLILELCQGGDLYEFLESRGGRVSETEARSIMRQLIDALEYLHERGIAHCDIKPNNVMFASANNPMSLRLIDFGVAQCFDAGSQPFSEHTGTTGFMAPEILYENYSEKCDIWSMGVLLFVLLYGFNPFDPYNKLSVDSIERRVLKGFANRVDQGFGAWFPDGATTTFGISEEARDIIALMLTKEVGARPNIYDLLDHPFFDIV